ncbi:MAG: hypothetical protein M3416_15505 [Acidobacteriota bacterium]|nr:hypothetical protein [Acidobacteriota bacterium]
MANLPAPVDVDSTNKFSPVVVRLGQDELVIEEPVVNSPDDVLLAHEGRENEVVDVHLDSARLDEQTVEDLSDPKFNPPATPGKIDYWTPDTEQTPAAGEPCRTFLKIELKDRRPPRALHLYQLGRAGADRRRHLEMKTGGAELAVQMSTDTPPEVTAETRGCRKLLSVGGLPGLSLPASTEVTAVAAADSAFRFYFRPLTTDAPLWEGGPGGFLTPFDLGPPPVRPDEQPPFQARAVSVRKRKFSTEHPDPPPALSARSVDGGPLLRVYDLEVGSDELRIKVSGRGAVSANGRAETVDLLKRAQEHPLLAGILTGLNAALLAWFVRLLTSSGARRAPKKS